MGAVASRSRLHVLRLERQAAALGRELLDDKREAILRALLERSRRRALAAAEVSAIHRRAAAALQQARIELGSRAVERAVLQMDHWTARSVHRGFSDISASDQT